MSLRHYKTNRSEIGGPLLYGLIAALLISMVFFPRPVLAAGPPYWAQWTLGSTPFEARGASTNMTGVDPADADTNTTISAHIIVFKVLATEKQWIETGWWRGAYIGGNCAEDYDQMTKYLSWITHTAGKTCETDGEAVEDTEYDYQIWQDGYLGSGLYKWRASIDGTEQFSYASLAFEKGEVDAALEVKLSSTNTGKADFNTLQYKPACCSTWANWPSRTFECDDQTKYFTTKQGSFSAFDAEDGSGTCD